MENSQKNKTMTPEERLELCNKLDKELDEFIEKLPRRKPEEGVAIEEWEEEVQHHPFFMTKPPEPGQDMHPLYEGLQALKYDPEYNAPDELAQSYRDDGNFNFKHKNYRLAIVAYTEGIKAKCNNPEIEAVLYNNRSASNYFLKNYRSALRDCQMALKLKPDYKKAEIRAAECCFKLKLYEKCLEYCEKILEKSDKEDNVQNLKQQCLKEWKISERDKRKKYAEISKKNRADSTLLNEIRKRGYNVDGDLTLGILEPCAPQVAQNMVHLNEFNNLVWPVALVYPEYTIVEYVQEFDETQTFLNHLNVMFEQTPEWDKNSAYKPDKLNIYYENSKQKLVRVDVGKTLGEILKNKEYIIKGGTPSFIILPQNSNIEKRYLSEYA